ncbi:MAG: CBS domain-containing protein [Nitrospina sp.]|jgi:signal-transduction protein with cAMP-binding, CBS, and nucleotidyltransferase domain|nr:CBS domain-containing protein [Nitrospina sp.]MBT3509432.1 CBS domain-containing protein [Nitrospina sp.]MBT3877017.1 CBS domain-containing protein [Nitrospina sp.]MBT4048788.1 CBS domain-containing protein [Nitrospina sp.]MBT4556159.1 CBS domain-containing protein [Nitrospina sp.]
MDEISDYMISTVLSIDVESSVQEAAQYMVSQSIGSVLVKEFDEYVGIVTETDLTRKVLGKGLNPETTRVSEIMTSPILSMDCYLPVEEANRFMHKNKIRHLVVTEEEKIVGILSVKDLVAYFSKDFRMQE